MCLVGRVLRRCTCIGSLQLLLWTCGRRGSGGVSLVCNNGGIGIRICRNYVISNISSLFLSLTWKGCIELWISKICVMTFIEAAKACDSRTSPIPLLRSHHTFHARRGRAAAAIAAASSYSSSSIGRGSD